MPFLAGMVGFLVSKELKFADLNVILQHGHDDIYPHHIFIDDEMNPPFPININLDTKIYDNNF